MASCPCKNTKELETTDCPSPNCGGQLHAVCLAYGHFVARLRRMKCYLCQSFPSVRFLADELDIQMGMLEVQHELLDYDIEDAEESKNYDEAASLVLERDKVLEKIERLDELYDHIKGKCLRSFLFVIYIFFIVQNPNF